MDPNFLLHLWCRTLPQCQDTLIMLRTSRLHPHMSSFTHTNAPFDYNAKPMAPPGIKTSGYETSQQHKNWAQHGVDAWYIGYCLDHYRCHKTYIPAKRGERIAHTVSFSLNFFSVPANNHQDNVSLSICDLTTALQQRYLPTPLQIVGDTPFDAMKVLEQILCPDYPDQTIPAKPPSVAPASIQKIEELPTATLPSQLSQQSASVALSILSQEHSANNFERNCYPTRFSLSQKTYSMACTRKYSYAAAHLAQTPAYPIYFHEHTACPVINPDNGASLEYRHLI